MKFFINPQEGDQIEFRQSSVYHGDKNVWFEGLPKDVQKHLKKEHDYRFGGNFPGSWMRFLDHVMHRTGAVVRKKGARL